ncbi:MAG: ABC transporter ATP-binding protein [Chloroflexota bacterium]
MTPLLLVRGLRAYYGDVPALRGVDLHVDEGEVVAILGANGVGKTTLLRAISRTVRTEGDMTFAGRPLHRLKTEAVARLGIGHVPEGRGTFVDLTVAENLRLGVLSRLRTLGGDPNADLEGMYQLFPVLKEMRNRQAGALSGGQQQMLALARVMLTRPRLLLLDELSLGLAPLTTAEIFGKLAELRSAWGLTVLLSEQNVRQALKVADRGYVLDAGEILFTGTATELDEGNAVERAYVGMAD